MRNQSTDVINIDFESPHYFQALTLRDQVLRQPLGLSVYDDDLSKESNYHHFGIVDANNTLLACLVVVPLEQSKVKIKQMAVQPTFHGQGLGRQLIQAVEEQLRAMSIQHITLSARVSAAGFYETLGYRQKGERFLQVTIPHIEMEKNL